MSYTAPNYIPKRPSPLSSSPLSSPPHRPSPLSSPALRGSAGPSNQVNETNRHDNLVTYFIDDAGQKHGLYTVHTLRGRLVEKQTYKHGQLEGATESYYDSGKLMSLAYFSANRLHGEYKRWAPNGQLLSHERFVNGEKEGLQESWYITGQIWQRFNMLGGKHHGKYELFDASGNAVEEYNYKCGKLHGVSLRRLDDGRVLERVFNYGELLRSAVKKLEDVSFDFEVLHT